MRNTPHIVVRMTPGIAPQEARAARARVWAFVFRCYESKKNAAAVQSVRSDFDGTENKENSAGASIIPRP